MTGFDIIDRFLKGEYPVSTAFLIVFGFLGLIVLFRKHIIKDVIEKLGLAKQADILALKTATQQDIQSLREATQGDIQSLKEATQGDIQSLKEATQGDIQSLREATQGDIQSLREATQGDIQSLKEATQGDIQSLREATQRDIQSLKENDLFHTNKALLILAKYLIKDDPQVYERIKDCILETAPESKKEDIKSV